MIIMKLNINLYTIFVSCESSKTHTISKQKQDRRPTEIGESLLESKHDLDLFFSPTILLPFDRGHMVENAGYYHASWP